MDKEQNSGEVGIFSGMRLDKNKQWNGQGRGKGQLKRKQYINILEYK